MKKIFFAASMVLSMSAFAQLNLTKGQKFSSKTEMTQNITMEMAGQQMPVKNDIKIKMDLEVTDVTPTGYVVKGTVDKFKMEASTMGQTTAYDSDKPDENPQLAEAMADVKKSFELQVEKATGKVSAKEGSATNKALEQSGNQTKNFFLTIPAGKKVGDSFTDSSSAEGNSNKAVYTITAVNGNSTDLSYSSTTVTNGSRDQGGMTVNTNMTMSGIGKMTVKSSVIEKNEYKGKIEGTVEAGGMTMPMSGDVTMSSKLD